MRMAIRILIQVLQESSLQHHSQHDIERPMQMSQCQNFVYELS
jgi:hypothetical protein